MSPKLYKPPFPIDRRLTTGRLIPGLTAVIGGLILLSGMLPLQWFRFQDYEIARHVLQWDSPFMPNVHVRSRFFQGNEAVTANLRPTETLGWRTFSTDRFGFRYSPPVHPGKPIEIAVFRGFSFVWGVGLGDEETFPAQLARETGMNAYNASRFHDDPETPEDFDALMAKIGGQPRNVVYVHLEPNAHVLTAANQRLDMRQRLLWFAKESPLQWIRMSPAILTAVEAKKAVEDDVILHNRYRDNVDTFHLPNGQRVLVRKGELERAQTDFDEATITERADYIAWWNRKMAERGSRMVVLLVPDKMSVYGPALGLRMPADPFLNRMERNLEARGIRVVNGLTVLRERAAEDVATGRLAYLREDEHWNPIGVKRLAEATAQALESGFVLESSKAP